MAQESNKEFRQAALQHVDWIANYLEHVRDLPVLPSTEPGNVIDALPASAPESGESLDTKFADFKNIILPALTLWNHPRFFAYFANSSTPPSILADMLASTVNIVGMMWKSGPAATELEQVTLSWLRQWLGLPK